MTLVNMKLDPKARKEKYAETVAVDRPVYPYGLEVRLDEDALEALSLSKLPKVDGELLLTAKVRVTSVSSNEHSSGEKGPHRHRNVTLQITDMALGDVPKDEKDASDTLYAKA